MSETKPSKRRTYTREFKLKVLGEIEPVRVKRRLRVNITTKVI